MGVYLCLAFLSCIHKSCTSFQPCSGNVHTSKSKFVHIIKFTYSMVLQLFLGGCGKTGKHAWYTENVHTCRPMWEKLNVEGNRQERGNKILASPSHQLTLFDVIDISLSLLSKTLSPPPPRASVERVLLGRGRVVSFLDPSHF